RANADRHVDEGGPFGLERGCDGDSVEPGVLQRPAHDLLGTLALESGVQLIEDVFGRECLHGDPFEQESPFAGATAVYPGPWITSPAGLAAVLGLSSGVSAQGETLCLPTP